MSTQDQNNLSIVSPVENGSKKYAIATIIILIFIALIVFGAIKVSI